MEEKKKVSLSTIVLILVIVTIIVVGVLIFILNHEKKAKSLTKTQLNNVQEENQILEDTTEDDFNSGNIILDGLYVIPDSDSAWNFTKDGRVSYNGNLITNIGTYKTTENNKIELHYTINRFWDPETGNTKNSNIDKYSYIYVDDLRNVYYLNDNGEKEELKRYGNVKMEVFEQTRND